jgi:hypothetical protein
MRRLWFDKQRAVDRFASPHYNKCLQLRPANHVAERAALAGGLVVGGYSAACLNFTMLGLEVS